MKSNETQRNGPLAGIRVLDMTRVLAGPFGTMILADLGADVIKVENPRGGDDTRHFGPPFLDGDISTYFLSINRGKRSITLNLKDAEDCRALERLVASCDVLIENFRPGVLDRLGFGAEATQKLNSRLIYASISGFGAEGLSEFVQSPGYDLLAQSLSGVASLTGPPESVPSKAGISVGDLVGGLYAVQGILAALYEREKTGTGRRVDISMLDGLVSLLTYHAGSFLMTGRVPPRMGNQHPSICHFETLSAADGTWSVCCGNDAQFSRLAKALGRPEWVEDARFATNADRVRHRPILVPMIEEIMVERPLEEWLCKLREMDVPVAPIQDVSQALSHPQLLERGMIGEVHHPRLGTIPAVGCPIRLDGQAAFNSRPAPALGEHTVEILTELGLREPAVE